MISVSHESHWSSRKCSNEFEVPFSLVVPIFRGDLKSSKQGCLFNVRHSEIKPMNLTYFVHSELFQKSVKTKIKSIKIIFFSKMDNNPSENGFQRKRPPVGRRSTGGKAPRKMLSHPLLAQWYRGNYPEGDHPDSGDDEKETQTYLSTSDNQVQVSPEINSVKCQTDQKSTVKLQKELATCREIIKNIEDEKTILWQRYHDATRLNKALVNERTSLCTKDCCKDQA